MPRLNILSAFIAWIVGTTGGALWYLPYNPSNVIVCALLAFNNLNILISICEILLGINIDFIKEDYQILCKKYRGQKWKAVLAFLTMPLPNVLDANAWSKMWSTYALYDPSYQNNESFGFFIDFGNGMSTIPPCLLWNYAMAFPNHVSPLWVGCIGIASYWQILYGTIVYGLSFCYNKRYKGMTWLELAGFVGVSNSLWFVFPILGLYCSVCILRDGNLSLFL
jgi:hypothetical protein